MMTPIWLGTSWKMNKPLSQAMAWCETLAARMPEAVTPLFSPSSFPPSPRSNPSAIFCKRISYRF
ncbi:Triosephosphate isomerase [Klebsiella pneumoniae IS22]|nr:Triosephosphate isomerase [Klebsiella pneumoniae IS22]